MRAVPQEAEVGAAAEAEVLEGTGGTGFLLVIFLFRALYILYVGNLCCFFMQ